MEPGAPPDPAVSLGVTRSEMHAQEVGGHMWARAGAVPKSWIEVAKRILGDTDVLAGHGRIEADRHKLVQDLVARGTGDHRSIRAIADLPDATRGLDGKDHRLGARLLVGLGWERGDGVGRPHDAGSLRGVATMEGAGEREREVRVNEVAGALAMRENGFVESDNRSIYGHSPPVMTPTEFERRFLARGRADATDRGPSGTAPRRRPWDGS